ncbi:MAG: hypothetical protein R3B09_35700, partial [Nannocystaceae bacterium]
TLAGTILGTPAYMAPEQFLALATDARTDVFSFCVALHEALYGRRPFAGATFDELRDAVCHGVFTPPPRDARVPAWLRARLLRGLAPAPDDRWQTLDALLAALTDDPIARRRRWLGAAALVALLTTIAVGLVLGIDDLRDRMAEQDREDAAALRWASIAERALAVDPGAGAEARAEAESLFHGFVTAAEVRGTRALTEAWLARGRRFYEAGDAERAMEAFAAAYTGAPTPTLERSTLLAIAAIFRGRWDVRALTPLVRTLGDAEGGAIDPVVDVLRVEVAIDHRDFAGAADLLDRLGDAAPAHLRGLQPVLRRLAAATDLGVADERATYLVDVDGDGRHELVDAPPDRLQGAASGEIRLRDLSGGAPRVLTTIDDFGAYVPVTGGPFGFVHEPGADAWVLLELTATGAHEGWRGRFANHVLRAHADDLDGDGAAEVYVTLAAYRRGLFRVDPSRSGPPSRAEATIVDPAVDRLRSDGMAITTDDLDGDGRRELILGLGPWKAYDLRILRWADGRYETVAHREIGAPLRIAALGAADGGRWLAASTGHDANPVVFPTPPHYGSPPGVHLFRLVGDRLVPGPTLPPPFDAISAGDVDGDGLGDLLYNGDQEAEYRLFLLRQGADGGFTSVGLGVGELVGVAQADDDPELEWVIRDGDRLWLFGHGSSDTPVRPDEQPPPRRPPPGLADPALVAHWERADRLAILGLEGLAARSLLDLAQVVDGPLQRAYVLERAADLFARAGDRRRAIEVLGDVDGDPAIVDAAAQLAAGHHAALGDYLAADAALPAGAPIAESDAFAPFTVDELHALADPPRRTQITFDRALDPAWAFASPATVERDHVGGRLVLAANDLHPAWATLPLRWDGGPILARVDVDVAALEYGSSLALELLEGDDRLALAALRCTGGAGHLGRFLVDHQGFVAPLGDRPAEAAQRLSITLAIAPERDLVTILFDIDGALHRRDLALARPLTGAPLRLTLGPYSRYERPLGQFRGALTGLDLIGLRPGPAAEDPRTLGIAALVEGRRPEALDLLRRASLEGPADRLALALALVELGRWAEARALVAPLAPDDAALDHLGEAYRAHEAMRPVLAEALGPRIHRVRLAGLAIPLIQHGREPYARRLLLTELDQLHAWHPRDPALEVDVVQLLLARAAALRELGDLAEARVDVDSARARITGATDDRAPLLGNVLQEEARLRLSAGDRAGARRAIAEILELSLDRDLTRGRLLRDPALRGALDDAGDADDLDDREGP